MRLDFSYRRSSRFLSSNRKIKTETGRKKALAAGKRPLHGATIALQKQIRVGEVLALKALALKFSDGPTTQHHLFAKSPQRW